MQLGADTGRMSSIKQTINRYLEIRSSDNVKAQGLKIVDADFS